MKFLRIINIFRRKDDGAMILEFAIAMPLLLLIFAIIVESGRLLWGYQTAVSGVRDASRYISRAVDVDSCITSPGGSNVDQALEDDLQARIDNTISNAPAFPSSVTLTGLEATVGCVPGDYRLDPVPVANVVASVTFTFPFSGIRRWFGSNPVPIDAQISSQSRVFGL